MMNIILQWICFNWIEIVGAILALLYLYLEIKQRNAMWVLGIISSLFYVYIFFVAKIYADMAMNVYYVLASIYGLWMWKKAQSAVGSESLIADEDNLATYNNQSHPRLTAPPPAGDNTPRQHSRTNVLHTPKKTALYLAGITIAIWCVLAFVLAYFTDSQVPYIDAFTTALSIVATWMLAHKLIEQWWVWLAVNIISMCLYFWRGLYPTAILFVVYSIASVIGYFQWKKSMR